MLQKAGLSGQGAYEKALIGVKQDPAQILATAQAAAQAANKPFDPVAALRSALGGYGMPATEANAATSYMNRFVAPREVRPWVQKLDALQNTFKNLTYSVFPSSHVRNLASGLHENAVEGTVKPGVYMDANLMLGLSRKHIDILEREFESEVGFVLVRRPRGLEWPSGLVSLM